MTSKFLLPAALALAVLAAACQPLETRNTIVAIAATGKADMTPDVAEVTGGIESRAPTAREALARQAAKMTAIGAAVQAASVKPEDMETAQISLSPVTDWTPRGGQRITGYVATNVVTYRVRDLAKVGEVLDAIVGDGGNRVDGVVFKRESLDQLESDARADAMRIAGVRAEAYAKSAGLKIRRIVSIVEGGSRLEEPGGYPSYEYAARAEAAQVQARAVSNTPVSTGAVDRAVTVQVNYEMTK